MTLSGRVLELNVLWYYALIHGTQQCIHMCMCCVCSSLHNIRPTRRLTSHCPSYDCKSAHAHFGH